MSKPKKTALEVYERIREILESARGQVARTVNTTQVVSNWLIGREIVEEEQQGKKRAGYGEALIAELSAQLRENFGRGYSVDNLESFRKFFLLFPDLLHQAISEAPPRKLAEEPHEARGELVEPKISESTPRKLRTPYVPENSDAMRQESWKPGRLNPNFSWTHYRTLLKVEKPEARSFYEIETNANHWSYRELERQINSLLYDRLALSRDKKGLMRLAKNGQEILTPADVFKDPVVIEFLGYVNYYDRERRTEGDQPTLGLILCTDKNDTVVKYTLGADQKKQIFASRYQLHLPTEAELKAAVEPDRLAIRGSRKRSEA